MRCQSCNYDNPADAAFCEECGTKLELLCPACKAPVSAGARFCKKCGAALRPDKSLRFRHRFRFSDQAANSNRR